MSEQDPLDLRLPANIFSEARSFPDESLWNLIVATTDAAAESGAPACPPLHRFALPLAFSPDESIHISACPVCQNTISLGWRLECPPVETLIGFLASGDNFPNREAMELHVERDECFRCARLLRDPVIQAIAHAIRLHGRAMAIVSGVWREGVTLGSLSASALRSALLGLSEQWLSKPTEWSATQPVMLSGEEESLPGETADTPFVVLEGPNDLQVLLEIQHGGNLSVALSGLGEHEIPPVLALVEQTPDGQTTFVKLSWNENRHLWTADPEGLANEFRVFILPPEQSD